MVDTGQLEAFLNEKSTKENDIVEILGEGEIEEKETQYGLRKMLNLPVIVDSKELIWTPSKTAIKEASKIFGSIDTKDWVGKKFAVGFIKMNVKGEIKDILIPKKI